MLQTYFAPSPSQNGSTQEGNKLLPVGANSFFLEKTRFQKGMGGQKSEQEVAEVVFLVKLARKPTKCGQYC